ncbi:NAD(P)/FAD-dependent oxidoreductase [Haladaptatus sp. QDMS2]|uniref:NAD(P)/FAD-dependent oxidoreductase n=1 Tax=Haladaptatus sp. QDMS2 TaxID=3033391 RepID=UPI0023E89079|nr:NAD(P)/FAD-dependent oxidoreductase [Haladaptatus sp. QDMS2]
MERVDVAIVGGGPAGSSAAKAAAQRGADAVVLEKGVPRADRERLGPDSTDAAGMLDYWIDLMDMEPHEFPEEAILSELDGAQFIGPTEQFTLQETGIPAKYDGFGFCFHRARFDDWLRDEAEAAGAEYRVKAAVKDVTTTLASGPKHTLTLRDGAEIEAEYLILADGPQRQVTLETVDQFMPAGRSVADYLGPKKANHIAYQEHREFPTELVEDNLIKFWWGVIPGHTAYPWVFPNDGNVQRVGLTMPIGMEMGNIEYPHEYKLLRHDDRQLPPGRVYLRRLLEMLYGDEYDIEDDFPLVEDRGKSGGTEAYPISSTRPIDSPVAANIAVTGGAMGGTSHFHEGGDHVAVRTGKLAGAMAASGTLRSYNTAWKRALGDEVLRSIAMADYVTNFTPRDWDHTFRTVDRLLDRGGYSTTQAISSGISGAKLLAKYRKIKLGYRNHSYVQIREDEYTA